MTADGSWSVGGEIVLATARSVMHRITSGNTNSPTVMIGQRRLR